MCSGLPEDCTFQMFAGRTLIAAEQYDKKTFDALKHAWHKVGVLYF
jgi:hypothetical protein